MVAVAGGGPWKKCPLIYGIFALFDPLMLPWKVGLHIKFDSELYVLMIAGEGGGGGRWPLKKVAFHLWYFGVPWPPDAALKKDGPHLKFDSEFYVFTIAGEGGGCPWKKWPLIFGILAVLDPLMLPWKDGINLKFDSELFILTIAGEGGGGGRWPLKKVASHLWYSGVPWPLMLPWTDGIDLKFDSELYVFMIAGEGGGGPEESVLSSLVFRRFLTPWCYPEKVAHTLNVFQIYVYFWYYWLGQ